MALGSGLGCQVDLSLLNGNLNQKSSESALFAEMIGSILIEVDPNHEKEIVTKLNAIPIGTIGKEQIIALKTGAETVELSMDELITVWEEPFRKVAR